MTVERPKTGSGKIEQELDKVEGQIANIQENILSASPAAIEAKAPEPSNDRIWDLSYREFKAADAPKITYTRMFAPASKPNPRCEAERKRGWEYVKCQCENFEIIGEKIEMWLCKWPGDPYTYWEIPVGKPIYLPRWVAEHLSTREYRRLVMSDRNTSLIHSEVEGSGMSQPTHQMTSVEVRKRLGCRSVGFGF